MTQKGDIETARVLLQENRSFEALALAERAFAAAPDDPDAKSCFGLASAMERGQVKTSIALCQEAVAEAPDRPHLYHNLVRVLLKAGRKPEALEKLREGLRRSPHDAGLQRLSGELGIRRRPVFPCLGRSHWLNKYSGLLLSRLRLR